jgi:NADPH2:quinone reductase
LKFQDYAGPRHTHNIFSSYFTALTLVRESYPLKKGDYVLVHAAAGGVGLLLCQMASHFGAHVIGTASTPEKAELAKQNGAEHVINYSKDSIVDKVLELTDGKGVQGIYDGVGKDTWEGE